MCIQIGYFKLGYVIKTSQFLATGVTFSLRDVERVRFQVTQGHTLHLLG